eukprot:s317_g36.t2
MPRPTPSPASPLALSAKASRFLLFLGAPIIFLHCIDYVVENTPPSKASRDLHNVDLFSGKGAIHGAFVDQKMKSKPFDVETFGPSGDILEVEGFLQSIQYVLRLREGGLATAGPPCGSFVFLNLATSQRSKTRPFGGPWAYVKRANQITCRMCLLLLLAFVRCAVHMGSYGHANLKPTVTFGSATWSYRLHVKITKSVRKRIQKNKAKKATVRKHIDQQGKVRVSGNPLQLKASQVYPKGYGKAIASIHGSWMADKQNVQNIRDALYPQTGGLVDKVLETVPKVPYRWRHASLTQLKDFLVSERAAGRSSKKPCRSPPEADSDASTVPATEKELQKAKQKRRETDVLITPPAKMVKVKKSESAETLSQPKLKREVQSKPVLEGKPDDKRVVLATAVKAKSAPKPKLEESQENAQRAQAVHDCLRRPSTTDMSNAEAPPKVPKEKTPATSSSPPEDPPPPGDDSSDSDEYRRKEKQISAKKLAHARYMRFSRSLKSAKTPPEVRRAGRAAFRDQGMLQVADQIINAKAMDAEVSKSHIRANPDLHGLDTPETRQYLIWDREGDEKTVDHVTTTLFQAAEKDEDEDSRGRSRVRSRKGKKHGKKHAKGKKSKGKKNKRSTSSSSSKDSSDTSSSDKTSSESDEKQAKGKKNSKKKASKKSKGGKGRKSSKSSSDSSAGKKKRKEETEEQKQKREQKELEEQKKKEQKEQEAERKKEEKEKEKEKKAVEKQKNDAFKKDLRKGNQAMTKLNAGISKGASLQDSDKLRQMSGSVVTAILSEVKPHIAKMKSVRTKLQKSIDSAKVGSLGTLLDDAAAADVWPTLVFHTPFMAMLMMLLLEHLPFERKLGMLLILMCNDLGKALALVKMIHEIFGALSKSRLQPIQSEFLWSTQRLPLALALRNMRTLNAVFRRLCWSLEAAFDGVNPQTGVGGKPLSENDQKRALRPLTRSGAKFALTECRGDWEYHVDVWRPCASWKSDTVCFRCPALAKGEAGNLYWNHGDGCTWESEEFGLESFVARRLKENNLCPLLSLRMFTHPSLLRWCTMHTINLGLLFTANGGSLILLTEELLYFGPGEFSVQLEEAYKHFLDFCRTRHIPHTQPPFLRKMVKKKNGEILLTAKAYNGRIILMFMTTMEANGRFLTQEAAESLHDSGMKFVNMHRALSVEHIRLQKSIWLMKPKLHVLIHICKDARRYS